MKTMSRGVDEAVVIGEIIVRVVEIGEHQVRLGISKPDARPRYREVTLTRESAAEPFHALAAGKFSVN